MKIKTFLKRGVLIVKIDGELDMHVADELRELVDQAVSTSGVKHILFNLERVNFIDSSGLGVILGRYKKICILGGKVLITSAQPQVVKVLELSGLLQIITLFHSEAAALECL